MKMFHVKRQLLALFMPGFLLGILYVNLEAEQFAAGAGIFSEYFLKQYQQVEILTESISGIFCKCVLFHFW